MITSQAFYGTEILGANLRHRGRKRVNSANHPQTDRGVQPPSFTTELRSNMSFRKSQPQIASGTSSIGDFPFSSSSPISLPNMPNPPADVEIPASYKDLPYRDIFISYWPAESPTPTPIVILNLNRPKAHNAFTGTMMEEMEHAFKCFSLDDRVKCVIVAGGNGRIFCAGADLTPEKGSFQGGYERPSDHRDG